jgi:hypothetical protein
MMGPDRISVKAPARGPHREGNFLSGRKDKRQEMVYEISD